MSQLALHTSKAILCAHLQVVALHFSKKTFHRLAPPNLALARVQSLAITPIRCQLCIASLAAPTHAKKRNAPLTIQGFATPTHLAHAHMQRKGMYFAPPIPKHCANGSCHLGPWFLHTSRVCNLVFLFTCVGMELSSISACIRRRSRRQPYATMTLPQQLQDIHPYMLPVSILRYVPK